MRIAALMNVIGREGMDLFDTFQWRANEDEGKFEDVGAYCVNSMKIAYLALTRRTRHINCSVGRSMQVRR